MRRFLAIFSVVIAVVLLVLTFCLRDHYTVPILTYHNVAAVHSPSLLNNVTPKSFAWQMKFLKKHRYHVISFEDYIDGLQKARVFARDTVVIHFDDGYEDNYNNAFPVLKKHKFPAMVFLVSDKIGQLGYLTWEQVKEMEAAGVRAGAHTRNHAYLPDLARDAAWDEIAGSKKVIEDHLGHSIDFFVYPVGGFSEETKELVEKAGFKAAGTTNRGKDRFNRDLFELNRIRIKDSDNALIMWAKLSGYYNLLRKTKCGSSAGCSKDKEYAL